MKIVIFGGTGLLGSEFSILDKDLILLGSADCDISNESWVYQKLNQLKPDIVVNAAAQTKSTDIFGKQSEFIDTNIIGSSNISKWCISKNKRLVYISTDYVYDGGGSAWHNEDEPLKPNNHYAMTKLAGEVPVQLVADHCIIRTSFGKPEWDYPRAYDNLWTSKDYVDVIAPMVLKVIKSDYYGIINVGTDRKSIYDYVVQRNPDVIKHSMINSMDVSMNLDEYKKLFNE
jgi:dTDP-4-dehydrorhamnose reductase